MMEKKLNELLKFASNTLRLPRNKIQNIQNRKTRKKYKVHQAFSILIMHTRSSAIYAVLAFCVA